MSADADAERPIIIVRRPRGGHDDHHGGAWKIAYADFMTAMMALFLVLWLVNASSEETKAAVASYFNPIELTDRNARPRGMDDPAEGLPGMVDGEVGASEAVGTVDATLHPASSEPSTPPPDTPPDDDNVRLSHELSASNGTGWSDDPAETTTDPSVGDPAPTDAAVARPFDPFALGTASAAPVPTSVTPVMTRDEARDASSASPPLAMNGDAASEREQSRVGSESTADMPADAHGPSAGPTAMVDAAPPGRVEPVPTPAAASAARAIAAELADALASAEVEVVAEAATVVIRLADDPARGMFALGSAAPRAGLAGDLAKVAASLAARPGPVSVHGHTDARPFAGTERGGGNWRLSAERAGAAHALLVAGGLDPARVARVVAHADRTPRETDGLSPRNRRIEIRLATGGNGG